MSGDVRCTVVVVNPGGVHARPSAAIYKTANQYRAHITIENAAEDIVAEAKALMEVMSLVAPQGTELVITAEGDDAAEAVAALVDLFRGGFPGMDT